MGMQLIDLVKDVMSNKIDIKEVEKLSSLADTLQYSYDIDEMVQNIYDWFYENYQIENFEFLLSDIDKNINCVLLREGEKFYLDDSDAFYFIIDTKTELNAIVSFKSKNKKHHELLESNKRFIEALFSQISPILQSGILKKLHLESSSVDSVTHVYNRKYLLDYLDKTMKLSNESQDDITFFMIGIDRFKAVIDEFDYDIGDKVLIELAKVIHKNIREKDIVARLTGDEFLVALLHVNDNDVIESIAQRIIEQFGETEITVDDQKMQKLKKTICVGISKYPQDNEQIDQVIKNADMFLYEAKNSSRGSYKFFSQEDESPIDFF